MINGSKALSQPRLMSQTLESISLQSCSGLTCLGLTCPQLKRLQASPHPHTLNVRGRRLRT